MSTFEIIGRVFEIQKLTSTRGNPYATFKIESTGKKVFEMSLFGESMQLMSILKNGSSFHVSGFLDSREYQDKNGKSRYSISPRVSFIKPYTDGGLETAVNTTALEALDEIPF